MCSTEMGEYHIVSADVGGALRLWDRRMPGGVRKHSCAPQVCNRVHTQACVDVLSSATAQPIVHVATSGVFAAGSAGLLASTSYDNTLRLFR
jgi:hypothetical protein